MNDDTPKDVPACLPAHDVLVDANNLACPLPLLKAKQALNRMQSGQVLLVLATDAGSWRYFQVFARQSGHELLHAIDTGNSYRYFFRKSGLPIRTAQDTGTHHND